MREQTLCLERERSPINTHCGVGALKVENSKETQKCAKTEKKN